MAVDDAFDAEPLAVRGSDSTAASGSSRRRVGDRARDRVLGGVLDRADEPQRLGPSTPGTVTTSTSAILPSVTVPVLSSTIVSTRRVDSSISGPLIRMPSCAPRPVPTSKRRRRRKAERARARDDQHGDGRREGERRRRRLLRASSRASPTAITITTGTKTADTRSASRCTGALPDCASSTSLRDLCERGVGADARRLDDEPAADVDRRAGDRVALADLDRHALARQQRRSTAEAPATTTPSVAIFSPGRTTNRSPTCSSLDRYQPLAAVLVEARDVLRAELDERAQRGAGAALRPRLEVAAGEQKRDHDGRDLEVDLARRRRARRRQLERHLHAGHAGVEEEERDDRPAPGGERAERDERVHRRGGVPQVLPGGDVERPACPEDDGGRELRARAIASSVNCSAEIIPISSTGSESTAATIEPRAQASPSGLPPAGAGSAVGRRAE